MMSFALVIVGGHRDLALKVAYCYYARRRSTFHCNDTPPPLSQLLRLFTHSDSSENSDPMQPCLEMQPSPRQHRHSPDN